MNINLLRNDFAKNYLKVSNKKSASVSSKTLDTPEPRDSVEVSPLASFRQKVSEAQDLTRQERLKQISQDVADGNYITEDKLNTSVGSAIESALGGL